LRLTELLNLIQTHPNPDDGSGEAYYLCDRLNPRACVLRLPIDSIMCNVCPLVRARGIITELQNNI